VPECLGYARELGRALDRGVARLLGANLGRRDGLARPAQPALDVGLLARARAKLVGRRAAALLVGGELLGSGVTPVRDGLARRRQRRGRPLRVGGGAAIAVRALRERVDAGTPLGADALGLLGEPVLRAELGHDLGLADRRGPVAGRLATPLDQPRRAPGGLGGLVALAHRGPDRALGLVPARPRVADRLLGGLGGLARRGLVGCGLRRGGDEPLAPVALLEDSLLAAGGRLADLACGGEVGASCAGRGDAGELGRQRAQIVHEPGVREEPLDRRALVGGGLDGIT
jgi:hypothetical protein